MSNDDKRCSTDCIISNEIDLSNDDKQGKIMLNFSEIDLSPKPKITSELNKTWESLLAQIDRQILKLLKEKRRLRNELQV